MGYRVLIVEDNPTNMELMSYLLSAYGHQVLTARDGEVGVAMAQQETPDVILCDIGLPTIDGFEVARRLRADAATRDIPLIAVTASAMVGDRDKVLAAGFGGYISKPLTPETFVSDIESYIRP